jgi:acyl-coenzyme A thioesterase PaaI-like protein
MADPHPAADADDAAATPSFEFRDHVIAKIGVHAPAPNDPCGPSMHLHADPVLLEPDGHLDFGALGVFLDLASSQAVGFGPFVHADISINRIARPTGELLYADATALRVGKRSSIVQVTARDSSGAIVADSTQQIVATPLPTGADHDLDPADAEARNERFRSVLDGVCRLPGRLHDVVGIARIDGADGAAWTMPNTPLTRNGFGGLHGGIAFDLVTHAAADAARDVVDADVEPHGALLRYLAPAVAGPFRAVPTVLPQSGGVVFVRVAIHDDGQDGKLCIVAEVHAAATI